MYRGNEGDYEQHEGQHEGRGSDCGCGGHGHGGMREEGHHHSDCGCHGRHGEGRMHHGCNCGCGCGGYGHHMGGFGRMGMMGPRMMGMGMGAGMGFGRRFISREEIITRLEEYLKQLQAEAKGVEERIAELKKTDEAK